ncbi:cohesin domain-containing protein [Candidatus Parcubacteria bacterium]|nr:cohesin domain-containing protein [Candidatus Parcubacteria bacterium]
MRSSPLKTLFALTLLAFLLIPWSVFADTIFVSPLTGTYGVGDTFTVRIMVSSPQQSINAISGVLSYPIDKLQVTSISKIGSVLSLWVQEPSFSNSKGTVSFEGIVPNPGFNESNGRVLAVNFRVVGTGPTDIRLTSGSLLANDGYGTNVLKTLGTASYLLEQKEQMPVTPPALLETSGDSGGKDEPGPAVIDLNKYKQPKEGGATFKLELPTWKEAMDWAVKFFSIVIPLLALLFLLIHTTKRGVGNIQALRKNLRKDLHGIDRLVEKSFDILKEDVSESIRILERARMKRRLTAEEDATIHSLRQSLTNAEKLIHQEVSHAEKDLDD